MTTAADGVEDWLSSMGPMGYLFAALVVVGAVAVAIRFMVEAGRRL
jgi:hypothetical protein